MVVKFIKLLLPMMETNRLTAKFLWVIALIVILDSYQVAFADGRFIEIEVKRNNGDYVTPDKVFLINFERRKGDPEAEIELRFKILSRGRLEIWESDCQPYISYDVRFNDPAFQRPSGNTIECSTENIVFNDVVYSQSIIVFGIGAHYSAPSQWLKVLAKNDESRHDPAIVAVSSAIATAVEKKDYGTVAIAGADIAGQLRRNGLYVQAEYFARVSYEATLQGIIDTQPNIAEKLGVESSANLTFVTNRNVVRMTPMAAKLVRDYKNIKNVIHTGSDTNGVIDWKTMRALVKNKNVNTKDFELPAGSIKWIAESGVTPNRLGVINGNNQMNSAGS